MNTHEAAYLKNLNTRISTLNYELNDINDRFDSGDRREVQEFKSMLSSLRTLILERDSFLREYDTIGPENTNKEVRDLPADSRLQKMYTIYTDFIKAQYEFNQIENPSKGEIVSFAVITAALQFEYNELTENLFLTDGLCTELVYADELTKDIDENCEDCEDYMECEDRIEGMIENILENFDFEKVQIVMELLNWTWYSDNGNVKYVPTTMDMITHCDDLLRRAYDIMLGVDETSFVDCGGFKATAYTDGSLKLEFILEDCNSDEC